jgi:hypothetical protein
MGEKHVSACSQTSYSRVAHVSKEVHSHDKNRFVYVSFVSAKTLKYSVRVSGWLPGCDFLKPLLALIHRIVQNIFNRLKPKLM